MGAGGASAPSSEGPSPGLLEYLANRADSTGFVAFDRFMEAALYAEGPGYYTQPRSPLGPGGDFYTAGDVSPLFAATLASRVHSLRTSRLAGRPMTLVELGPGDGRLTAGIVRELGGTPNGVDGLRVVLAERSATLRAVAHRTVRDVTGPLGIDVRLVETVGELGPFEGVVLANELLDAQPVRRLRWTGSTWRELGVRVVSGRLLPEESELQGPVPGLPLPQDPVAGTIVEVSPLAEAIVREVADHLVRGVWLLDDYGMEEPELVRGHSGGTLAAVRGHREVTDPLTAPGRTDLSAFVNWTRVRAAATAAGLAIASDRTQAEALVEWGLPVLTEREVGRVRSSEEAVRIRLAVKNLLFGFERFRILELAPTAYPAGPT